MMKLLLLLMTKVLTSWMMTVSSAMGVTISNKCKVRREYIPFYLVYNASLESMSVET